MKHKYLNIKNYYEFILKIFFLVLSFFLKFFEKRYLNYYGHQPLNHEPVFIIGAPRTGSTILYQSITNQLNVLYIDNLICRLNRNLFFGFWLSQSVFKNRAHNSFQSVHGDTSKNGLNSPSECGDFWYRWLPKNKHFIDSSEITNEMVEEIRKEITAVINYFDKPLVFKNLNAGQRLALLKRCFPNAKFIFMKREPLFVAQSILKAKRKIGLEDNDYWSIKPKNFFELEKLHYSEQIVKQIFFLEKQIYKDSKLFLNNNFLQLSYIDFLKDTNLEMEKVKTFLAVEEKEDYCDVEIKVTEKLTLSDDEISKFKHEIDKIDWNEVNEV